MPRSEESWGRITVISRRNEIEITKEVLSLAKVSAVTKTQIVYRCNLNFAYAQKLIDKLSMERLISFAEESGRKTYSTTSKGIDFLYEIDKMFAIRQSRQ